MAVSFSQSDKNKYFRQCELFAVFKEVTYNYIGSIRRSRVYLTYYFEVHIM